jgi:hypothetical protein
MIVATTTDIYIVLIIQNENKTLSFVKSDFVYPVSDYYITSIVSTSERRVFLGSQDNYLYELDYTVK